MNSTRISACNQCLKCSLPNITSSVFEIMSKLVRRDYSGRYASQSVLSIEQNETQNDYREHQSDQEYCD